MGGTIVGECGCCRMQIDRDPMGPADQYCDSCQTHMDLLKEVAYILKANRFEWAPEYYHWEKLEEAADKFCITL